MCRKASSRAHTKEAHSILRSSTLYLTHTEGGTHTFPFLSSDTPHLLPHSQTSSYLVVSFVHETTLLTSTRSPTAVSCATYSSSVSRPPPSGTYTSIEFRQIIQRIPSSPSPFDCPPILPPSLMPYLNALFQYDRLLLPLPLPPQRTTAQAEVLDQKHAPRLTRTKDKHN